MRSTYFDGEVPKMSRSLEFIAREVYFLMQPQVPFEFARHFEEPLPMKRAPENSRIIVFRLMKMQNSG